jgi:multiple sugar transport system substrate-binding protein
MSVQRSVAIWLLFMLCLPLAAGCSSGETERKFLVFSYGRLSPQHDAALAELVAGFEKDNPSIRVVLHSLAPSTDLQHHFYLQSFASRSEFVDVFEMDTIWSAELAAAGVLANPPAPLVQRVGHFEPQTLYGASYGDSLVAVPAFPAVSVLYYRSDLLTKYGGKVPTSWEELSATASKIAQAEGIDGFVWQAAPYEGLVCNFFEFYLSHGGSIEILDKAVVLDPALVEQTLKTMRGLIDSGASPATVTGYRETESRDRFLSGKALFARDWDDLSGFIPGSDVSGKVGIAHLPGTALHRGAPTLGGWHLGVNKYSQSHAEAWMLVEYLTSPESQAFVAKELGRLPADLQVPLPVRAELAGLEVVREALAIARPRPMSPNYYLLSKLLQTHVHQVLEGLATPQAGAQSIVSSARKIDYPKTAGPEFPRALLNPSTLF